MDHLLQTRQCIVHFTVETVVQAVPERRAVPFRGLAYAVYGHDEVIVIFRRVDVAQIRIAVIVTRLYIKHAVNGFRPHVEDVPDAVLYRPAPYDVLQNVMVVLDMPVVISQNLYSRVIIRRFDVFMLCLCESVAVAGGNVTSRFVKTVTA